MLTPSTRVSEQHSHPACFQTAQTASRCVRPAPCLALPAWGRGDSLSGYTLRSGSSLFTAYNSSRAIVAIYSSSRGSSTVPNSVPYCTRAVRNTRARLSLLVWASTSPRGGIPAPPRPCLSSPSLSTPDLQAKGVAPSPTCSTGRPVSSPGHSTGQGGRGERAAQHPSQ